MKPLFHPRVLKKAVKSHPLPEPHRKIVEDWRVGIETGQLFKQKDTSLHAHFIQTFFIELLGYERFSATKPYHIYPECPIGRGQVDIALGYFDAKTHQILAPCELKSAQTKDLDAVMPGRNKSPVQQVWEYGMDTAGAKWMLISNYVELRLYAMGYGRQAYETWSLARLTEPLEYARFILLLSRENLLEGGTARLLKDSEHLEKEITDHLYQEYKALRHQLILSLKADHPALGEWEMIQSAQLILDRVLFIAFAEETGWLPQNSLKQAFLHRDPCRPRPIWENFQSLFEAIERGNAQLNIPAYYGGLFSCNKVLKTLMVRDEVCEQFKNIGEYDFATEVSVTVLGHIFEQSISDLEELRAEVQEGKIEQGGQRKREGVVYTPDRITRFIVEETLGSYLAEQFEQLWVAHRSQRYQGGAREGEWKSTKGEIAFWRAYQDGLRAVKVVDPACGSGAFLVAAFDYLHAEYKRVNNQLEALSGSDGLFDLDKEILNKNLYGVDINPKSIEITKLSLWLKTAQRGKVLNSLDDHLWVGDSLIDDAQVSERAFAWKKIFPQVFKQGGFDVVLGNPPYVRMELLKTIKPYLKKHYQVVSDRADLYYYFYERGIDLLKPEGKLGYISSSTFFKTGSGKPLRRYLLEQTTVEKIIDFGDIQLFDGMTTYPVILIMKKSSAFEGHQLDFLKLDQLPKEELRKTFHLHKFTLPQIRLSAENWCLEDDNLARLRSKIIAGKSTLKEMYGSPYMGIKTGFNEAFVIERATRDKLIAQDAKSAELIKPFLEGKDLKKWRTEPRDLWLIYIPKNQLDIENYPSIKQYLLPFRKQLEQRATKQAWFELQQPQQAYQALFEKEKIVYVEIANKPQFSLDKNRMYFNATAFIIPSDDLFLLGLMNSHVIWFFWKGICTFLRGGFLRLKSQFLNFTPIPRTSAIQKTEVATLAQQCQHLAEARYQKQEAVRHRIPDLCSASQKPMLNSQLNAWWTLDFKAFRDEVKECFKTDMPLSERNEWEKWFNAEKAEIEKLTQQLSQAEQQLNQKVYVLFELTEEEIQVVEENV